MRIQGFGRDGQMSYYRVMLPFDELNQHGHNATYEYGTTDKTADPDTDLIVGHMIGHPRWWRSLRKHAPLVIELDDDPFEVEKVNPAYPVYGDPLARDNIKFCIQAADLVTTSVVPLAERLAKLNPRVAVLPNRIDKALLDIERKRNERVTIGWAGGASHCFDILECARGMQQTMNRNPNIDVHLIGADFRFLIDSAYELKRKPKYPIRFTDWSSKVMDYYHTIDFDIGLAPLKPTKFSATKSAIKALEYAALGIPVIASDTGPYADFVLNGVTGWLVRKPHEWAVRMRELINDEAMRAEMGAKGKEQARRHTIQEHWSGWADAYQGVV